jgi:catechol 1,2-dioxygenase
MSAAQISAAKTADAGHPRLNEVFDDLLTTLRAFIGKHHITHDEYRRMVALLTEAGKRDGEISLLMDVFLEATVDQVDSAGRNGTESAVEGPFYVPDAPVMKTPCVLPHRANEPGDVLIFSGIVRGTDGSALGGAIVDIWHADAEGAYSHFNIPKAEAWYNLRARVATDDRGRFEIQTWVTAPYQIPKDGPTGALLAALGRHAWRPAHIHARVSQQGFETLTTQVFLKDSPWIDSDVVGAVKPSLITGLEKHEDPAERGKRGLDQPYFSLNYDFVLPPSLAKAA